MQSQREAERQRESERGRGRRRGEGEREEEREEETKRGKGQKTHALFFSLLVVAPPPCALELRYLAPCLIESISDYVCCASPVSRN